MTSDTNDPVIEALNKIAAEGEDTIWRTNQMATLTVRLGPGKFRKSAFTPGDPELFFKCVRPGARDKIIFEFEPVDSRPFEAIEIDNTKVFGIIDGFEKHLTTALGFPPVSEMQNGLEVTQQVSFAKAIGLVRKRAEAEAKELAAAAEAAAATSDATRYAKNPLWGAF